MQPSAVVIEIIVPRNIRLFCNTSPIYNLDNDELDRVLRTIYQASPSQFVVRERGKNLKFLKAVRDWNRDHPDDKVTYQTIVQKAVNEANYAGTFEADASSADRGEIFHQFKNVKFPPFFDGKRKNELYIKFIDPVPGEDIDVVSLHRNKDR